MGKSDHHWSAMVADFDALWPDPACSIGCTQCSAPRALSEKATENWKLKFYSSYFAFIIEII